MCLRNSTFDVSTTFTITDLPVLPKCQDPFLGKLFRRAGHGATLRNLLWSLLESLSFVFKKTLSQIGQQVVVITS